LATKRAGIQRFGPLPRKPATYKHVTAARKPRNKSQGLWSPQARENPNIQAEPERIGIKPTRNDPPLPAVWSL